MIGEDSDTLLAQTVTLSSVSSVARSLEFKMLLKEKKGFDKTVTAHFVTVCMQYIQILDLGSILATDCVEKGNNELHVFTDH